MSDISDESRTAPCNRCLRLTNHKVLWNDSRPWDQVIDEDDQVSIWGANSYSVLECAGCGDVRLLHAHWFSEDTDDRGQPETHEDYYPPTVTRQKPSWRRNILPFHVVVVDFLNPLFDEIYSAHAAGAYTIAVMGIRALTEKIMVDQVGSKQTFAEAVDAFFAQGFVAGVQQQRFKEVLIEAGHAAIHRNFRPSRQDVETLLDLIEGLVDQIYYQPMRTNAVGKNLPPDTRRKRPRDISP